MTSVDFYILPSSAARMSCELLACRLAEKAYHIQHQVYVHTQSQQDAAELDELLWTFNQGSFLPHQRIENNSPSPITIGYGLLAFNETPLDDYDVMINLSHDIPKHFSRFSRVAEIVGSGEEARTQSRERYRFYRDRGYPLKSHALDG